MVNQSITQKRSIDSVDQVEDRIMKKLLKIRKSMVAAALMTGALALTANVAFAGIANTKHNLGSNGGTGQFTSTATGEICVYCHTPHGADTNAAVPLWNKVIRTDVSVYARYSSVGTTSFDADEVAIGSVSIACLSCHCAISKQIV